MKLKFAPTMFIFLSTICFANDATQQIEEIVVTGAVRSSEAIEIAAIDLPGDSELKSLPIISE